MSQKYVVYKMHWSESEAGWGSRPDGISLHKTVNDGNEYIKKYWKQMPKETPYEYSKPDGSRFELLEVNKEISDLIDEKINIRYLQSEYRELVKNGLIYE